MIFLKMGNDDLLNYRKPLHHKDFPLILMWSEKSGCTTLVKWFFYQIRELEKALEYHPWIHDYENEVFKIRENYTEELRELMESKKKPVFKLVRDPYKRSVSSFLMLSSLALVENKNHFAHMEWEKLRKFFHNNERSEMGISYKQFLYYLKAKGSKVTDTDGHFAQQYLKGEEKFVTKYIKLENFNKEIADIEKKFNLIPSSIDISESEHHRSSTMTQNVYFAEKSITKETFFYDTPPTYASFYDEETIDLVREIFQKDFELFGYDIEKVPK